MCCVRVWATSIWLMKLFENKLWVCAAPWQKCQDSIRARVRARLTRVRERQATVRPSASRLLATHARAREATGTSPRPV